MSGPETIDDLVTALYESMSFEPGGTPDEARFRALFLPGAQLLPPSDEDDVVDPVGVDAFLEISADAVSGPLRDAGLFEREVARATHRFGPMAQLFSTYETRHAAGEPEPMSRGINNLQVVRRERRWWIVSMTWDDESPLLPLPARFLPPEA